MTVDPTSPSTRPSLGAQVLLGILAAAFLGALWGVAETSGRFVYFRFFADPGLVTIPEIPPFDGFGAIVLSGLEYALVGAVLGLIGTIGLSPLLRVVTGRDASWCAFVGPRFTVAFVAVFFNLFWWSRFVFVFAYSERFYSPKRLALSFVLAIVAVGAATWLVRKLLAAPRLSARKRTVALALVAALGVGFLLRERMILADVPQRADAQGRYNVVFVIVDTLRADRLGCYGYSRPTSPRIDKIAAESVLFERAIVQAPYTWTSFGSFFTGKYPRKHGLLKMDPTLFFEPKQNLTIQRILRDRGYRTSAFLTGMLSNASGLLDGFETYLESTVARDVVHRRSVWTLFRSELVLRMIFTKVRQALDPSYVADEAVDWIDDNRDARFFTLVHLYSTHTPYDPPKQHDIFSPDYRGNLHRFTNHHTALIHSGQWQPTPQDVQRINDLYDGGVHHADAMIGGIYEVLMRRGLLEDTVLVISSDHGEELGERGLYEHNWMYNTNQRVPFVVRAPDSFERDLGVAPRTARGVRVDVPIESVDFLPTMLEVLGIPLPPNLLPPSPEAVDGESLLPWFLGARPKQDDFVFCENTIYLSVQNRDWKLVKTYQRDPKDPPRLYDLRNDPGEFVNRYESEPEARAMLEAAWDEFDRKLPPIPPPKEGAVNSALMDHLREHGYLGDAPREGVLEAQKRRLDPGAKGNGSSGDGAERSKPPAGGTNGASSSSGGP
jgi:arylsulfatase